MEVLDDLQAALDGRYEIERELGRGGMAVVYLARDLKHDRQVAIKVLPPEMAAGIGTDRFLREIRTAAQLAHPNILPLHDSIAAGHVRCYVMPYVRGESLRQRIDRERQLGIEQAVDVARQVAAGLDYAHAQGIVHRDIKPENILLVGDQAVIADFGLARALNSASTAPFTGTGIAVGTPAYMSPEQAAADTAVDGRTDVYALGCMFFEMVSGMPPFRGATLGALLAAHATREPPSLCAERASCPPAMDAAVHRALAKVPADRFRTAGDFVHALESWRGSASPVAASVARSRRQWVAWGAGLATVAVIGVATPSVVARVQEARTPLDSNAVVLLPVGGTGGRRQTPAVVAASLTSALGEWHDLKVLELDGAGRPATSDGDASLIGRRNGAGFVLVTTVAQYGDSVAIHAALHDTRSGSERQRTIRIADDSRGGIAPFQGLVADLLRASDAPENDNEATMSPGTSRVAAWRAFTLGQKARAQFSLDEAEAHYRRALASDPSFARAQLWLAQTLAWTRPSGLTEWRGAATAALAYRDRLNPDDTLHARALVALALRRYPEACAAFYQLTRRTPESEVPWFGLGQCLVTDPVVIRDETSPTGWSFRSSWHSGVAAYDSALTRTSGAPTFAFRMLRSVLLTERLRTKRGLAAPPDSMHFHAYPALHGDSVAYVPLPAYEVEQGRAVSAGPDRENGLLRNREHLRRELVEWVRRAPSSTEALSALAWLQEVAGDRVAAENGGMVALNTLREARRLSTDPREQLTLAVSQVRVLVKSEQLTRARSLADSLLGAIPSADTMQAQQLAGVAALIGNLTRTRLLLRTAGRASPDALFPLQSAPPAAVADAAADLLADASLGVCNGVPPASLVTLDRLVEQYVSEDARRAMRRALETRSVSLLVPCAGAQVVAGVPGPDPLLNMQQAYGAGKPETVRALMKSLLEGRRGSRPADIALDHLYQEAWLFRAIGDSAAATRHIGLPLAALSMFSSRLLEDVPSAAALGRSMALYAELAAAQGDTRTAHRYAQDVLDLWKGASPELGTTLRKMQDLTRSQ